VVVTLCLACATDAFLAFLHPAATICPPRPSNFTGLVEGGPMVSGRFALAGSAEAGAAPEVFWKRRRAVSSHRKI